MPSDTLQPDVQNTQQNDQQQQEEINEQTVDEASSIQIGKQTSSDPPPLEAQEISECSDSLVKHEEKIDYFSENSESMEAVILRSQNRSVTEQSSQSISDDLSLDELQESYPYFRLLSEFFFYFFWEFFFFLEVKNQKRSQEKSGPGILRNARTDRRPRTRFSR